MKTECLGTKPQADKAEHLEEINQDVVIRSNGKKRYFSTLMRVLSIFDREDLNVVYQLVMDRYQDEYRYLKDFENSQRYLGDELMVMSTHMMKMILEFTSRNWNIAEFGSYIFFSEGTYLEVMKNRISHSYACRKEVSFEKESTCANAETKVGV
ncbi:hypothetical protein Tco_1438183 [Tanacetum coccineum]